MDAGRFSKYYNELQLPLGMFALRLLGDVDLAAEVVQRAFVATWEKIADGADIVSVKAYMYRAVRNEALTELRRLAGATADVEEAAEITDEVIDNSERDAALWHAIDCLPPRCREVFLMSKRDGLSNAEIAAELDISVKTVEAQMTRALHRLRDALTSNGSRKVFFLPFL